MSRGQNLLRYQVLVQVQVLRSQVRVWVLKSQVQEAEELK